MTSGKYETGLQSMDRIVSRLQSWWGRYHKLILTVAIAVMALIAILWLGYESYRLLRQPDQIGAYKVHPGAIDLKQRYVEVHCWFSGAPVSIIYPPATYLMLWPFLGWLDVPDAIALWALTTAAALVWLILLLVKESGAGSRSERIFVALIPLSIYATGATIGNGQLIIHILPALVTGILLLSGKDNRWFRDLMISFLMIVSLAKPSISVPFFLIVLFVRGGLRPAAFACLGYTGLTFIAALFQKIPMHEILYGWLTIGSRVAVAAGGGHSNVAIWLASLGLGAWGNLAALFMLSGLGLWIYRHRRVDLWLLMGVTAIIARIWAYHRWYDDLLILLPMVALFRMTKQNLFAGRTKLLAGWLLAVTLVAMMAPGGLYLFPQPWNTVYLSAQVAVWIIVLLFIAYHARQLRIPG